MTLETTRSRYSIVHALAATALMVYAILHHGVAAFWKQFVHGFDMELTPALLLASFATTAALFGSLILVLWASTLFSRDSGKRSGQAIRPDRCAAVWLAVRWAPLLTGIAIGLNWICASGIEWLAGVQPSDQELVKCLSGDVCPLGTRIALGLLVLFEAPLLEEPLFRGILFRGYASALPVWLSMALSGFVFALVHVNAATFVPLWFLGVVFAELYRRTGTLLAPMTAHALFNAVNLALLPFLAAE